MWSAVQAGGHMNPDTYEFTPQDVQYTGQGPISGYERMNQDALQNGGTFQRYGADGTFQNEGFADGAGFDPWNFVPLAVTAALAGPAIFGAMGGASGGAAAGGLGLGGTIGGASIPAGMGYGAGMGLGSGFGAGVGGMGLGSTFGAGLSGLAGAMGAVGGGGLGSTLVNKLGGKMLTNGLSSLFGGGSGGGLGGLGNLIPGALDAQRQGQASDRMLQWLNGQQGKIDNLYNPGSPEANALWDQMSRKDAAAGRNSQYGPRSVDLGAKIAQIKAENTMRMTTGVAPAYAAALNQGASRFSGLMGGLGQQSMGGTLNDIINQFTSGGSSTPWGINNGSTGMGVGGTMSNNDIWDMINGGGTDVFNGVGGGVDNGIDVLDWFI